MRSDDAFIGKGFDAVDISHLEEMPTPEDVNEGCKALNNPNAENSLVLTTLTYEHGIAAKQFPTAVDTQLYLGIAGEWIDDLAKKQKCKKWKFAQVMATGKKIVAANGDGQVFDEAMSTLVNLADR
ncbi:hypothetical protein BGZ58_001530, partial [Dissophora ornata]